MTLFVRGKQKRVPRLVTIEGGDVDEFIARNADPIWLHLHEMWEDIPPFEQASGADHPHVPPARGTLPALARGGGEEGEAALSVPNPFDAPRTEELPPGLRRLGWNALPFGILGVAILVMDGLGWAFDSVCFGTFAIISRVAMFVGGLVAWGLVPVYAVIRGPRSESVREFALAGLLSIGTAVLSTGVLFVLYP